MIFEGLPMDNIELTFTGEGYVLVIDPPVLVLSIDETGKHVPTDTPKRVEKAFTRAAIDKILSLDEIPYKDGYGAILDGNRYHITIKKGNLVKEYFANDLSIETYPLLRYLASWYRRWL